MCAWSRPRMLSSVGALREQEDRQHRRRGVGDQRVALDPCRTRRRGAGAFGVRTVSAGAHGGPPGAVRGSGRRRRRGGRARRARARPAPRRRSGSPSRRGGCARAAARRTGRGRRRRSGRARMVSCLLTRPPGGRWGGASTAGAVAVQRPASVAVDLVREDAERAAEEAGGAVGMAAGSAAGRRRRPTAPGARGQLRRARGPRATALEGVGDRAQAVEARSALAGALGGQLVQDASRLPDAARALAEHPEDAGADRAGARGAGRRSPSARPSDVLRVEPGRAVAADEERLRAVGEAARRGAGGRRAGCRARSRRRRGRATAPPSVTSAVPGCDGEPERTGTSPAPWRAISARCASVSTLPTSVGRLRTPRSNGRGGTVVGQRRPGR